MTALRIFQVGFLFLVLAPPSIADLAPEVEQAIKAYHAKRSEGLIKLNNAFIKNLLVVKAAYVKEKNTDLADRTQAKIEKYAKEIEMLGGSSPLQVGQPK